MRIKKCCVNSLIAERLEVPLVYVGSEAKTLPEDGRIHECRSCTRTLVFRYRRKDRKCQWFYYFPTDGAPTDPYEPSTSTTHGMLAIT